MPIKVKRKPRREIITGKAVLMPETGDWALQVAPNGFLSLGAIANVKMWNGRKVRITISEVR